MWWGRGGGEGGRGLKGEGKGPGGESTDLLTKTCCNPPLRLVPDMFASPNHAEGALQRGVRGFASDLLCSEKSAW